MTHEHTDACNHDAAIVLDSQDQETIKLVMTRYGDVLARLTLECLDETILELLARGELDAAETVAYTANKLLALEHQRANAQALAALEQFDEMTPEQLMAKIQSMLVSLSENDGSDEPMTPGLSENFGDGPDASAAFAAAKPL